MRPVCPTTFCGRFPGTVVAIASKEPAEYYKDMKVDKIIKNFHEMLEIYKSLSE